MSQYEVLMPTIFQDFSCKCSDCRSTCCNGWSIAMTAKDYKKLCAKNDSVKNYIHSFDQTGYAGNLRYELDLCEDGFCPFLNEQSLCSIQVQYGADCLPSICLEYPRTYHKYMNKLEFSLSLGCEKALELLYSQHQGLTFTNQIMAIPDYQRFISNITKNNIEKYPVLNHYYEIQSLCLGVLQAEDATIEDRFILLGMALFHIDELVKKGKYKQIPSYINSFIQEAESIDALTQIETIKGKHVGALFSYLQVLQLFDSYEGSKFTKIVEKISKKLYFQKQGEDSKKTLHLSEDAYAQCQKQFQTFMDGKEYFLENIAVAGMLYFNMPFHRLSDGVKNDFTFFLMVFAILKFTMTVYLDESGTIEDMIDCCAIIFRHIGHSEKLYQHIIQSLEETNTTTMGHLAILLKSC